MKTKGERKEFNCGNSLEGESGVLLKLVGNYCKVSHLRFKSSFLHLFEFKGD